MILICDSRADADLRLVVTAWVGDSSAWILHPSGLWSCISANTTEDEEIAKSATDALPVLPSAGIDVRVSTIAPGDVLLSMTDGVGVALDKGRGEVAQFLAEAWKSPPHPLTFAAQVDFARKSYDDDRTVIGVWATGKS